MLVIDDLDSMSFMNNILSDTERFIIEYGVIDVNGKKEIVIGGVISIHGD